MKANRAKISRRHWIETAKICHFPERKLNSIFDEIESQIQSLLRQELELPKGFSMDVYENIMEGLVKSLSRLNQ